MTPDKMIKQRCADRACQAELSVQDVCFGLCPICGSMIRNVATEELEARAQAKDLRGKGK